jgi:hypothetical protein
MACASWLRESQRGLPSFIPGMREWPLQQAPSGYLPLFILPPGLQEFRHEPRPAGLMRRADAAAGVAVEKFVE